jgi:hypothetical protein
MSSLFSYLNLSIFTGEDKKKAMFNGEDIRGNVATDVSCSIRMHLTLLRITR